MDEDTRAYFEEIRRELNARFDTVDGRFDAVDARFDEIDARFGAVDARFGGMDARFTGIDGRFDAVEARITSEVAAARRELGVLIEQVRHQLAIVAETTIGHGHRLTANEAAIDRLREDMGLQMAELRVAITDLRARR